MEFPPIERFAHFTANHEKGTIIFFDNIKDGIRNTEDYLKKIIALYFRFSLLDSEFTIHFNEEPITTEHLSDLADKTQFVWLINNFSDPFVTKMLLPNKNLKQHKKLPAASKIGGFVATVNKPSDLKIIGTDEKVSVDLFVNGRLREKDVLRHISSARIVENYLYGQIHYDILDDENDRFTSSREGIVANDPLFENFLEEIKSILGDVINEWDKWRIDNRQDGDPDNSRISKRARKSKELFNVISNEFIPPKAGVQRDKVEEWVKQLGEEAEFNFASYGECFISENLVRSFIKDKNYPLSKEAESAIKSFKEKELKNKNEANLSIELRKNNDDLSYLAMDDLANLVDKVDPLKLAGLSRDAKEYKPVRDAMAHTALLTHIAKARLTLTYENIKARVKNLLNTP